MELADFVEIAIVAVLIQMTTIYLFSIYLKDLSIVDIGWGLGFVLVAWIFYSLVEPNEGYKLLTLLVSVWGLRLSLHLFNRKRGSAEDWRYRDMRLGWGDNFWWRSYIQIILVQALLLLVVATPILISAFNNEAFELTPTTWIGGSLWLVGFFFEAVGDWQLARFVKHQNKKKKTFLTTGVWRFTRHPNYFGEVIMWWGIWLMIVELSYGWWALISPITITYLLIKVSGIPRLENKYASNKQFKAYKAKTSAFLPLPTKKR